MVRLSHISTGRRHWSPFLLGIARMFGLRGLLRRRPTVSRYYLTDAEALRRDWQVVGDDLRWAIQRASVESNVAPEAATVIGIQRQKLADAHSG